MTDPTVNPVNLDIGPCIVTYDGVDLGGTLDNVVISIKYPKANLTADQTGSTPLDKSITGVEITVATSLAETRVKDNWKVAFPHGDLVTVGAQKYIQWANRVANRDYALAKALILHPMVENPTVKDMDHYFWKALASEESSFTLGYGEQYKLNLVWTIYPDISVQPYRFYRHGDYTI